MDALAMKDDEMSIDSIKAADMAVKKVFAILGVNVDDPESVEEFREDLRFGKKMRKAADKGFLTVFVLAVSGFCTLAWWGISSKFSGH